MGEQNSFLIGPFAQLLTMRGLPFKGALGDEQLELIVDAGMWVVDGKVKEINTYVDLFSRIGSDVKVVELDGRQVCIPAFIDCHTHILFGGSRADDFAMRNGGSSYLEIAAKGGGIWSTVRHTRTLSLAEQVACIVERAQFLIQQGITTIEVKSGYGLSVDEELKSLRAIAKANKEVKADLVATCLAAHMLPKDYKGSHEEYLTEIATSLFPKIIEEGLTNRVDAFIEQSAFSDVQIAPYFQKAKSLGFDITVHGDQFTCSGSKVAVDFEAVSVDHLEVSTDHEIALLASSDVVAVALPAASLGLGCTFTPARQLLDAGASLAIATDWNPGSAPMGSLMTTATILATVQKLTNAEVLAAITFRAAKALNLEDRGRLVEGMLADFLIYDSINYQEITYSQGRLLPKSVWKNGIQIFHQQ